MKCFNHNERDAFAVCCVTGKGLCMECLEDYNGRIICKDSTYCREKEDTANGMLLYTKEMIPYNERVFSHNTGSGKNLIAVGIFFLLISVLTCIMAKDSFWLIIDVIFGIFGVVFIISGSRLVKLYKMKS